MLSDHNNESDLHTGRGYNDETEAEEQNKGAADRVITFTFVTTFPEGKNYSSGHTHEHAPLCVVGGRTPSLFFINDACGDF